MAWPTIFANLAAGNQNLSLFDTMFTQVAQMVAVPCTVTGVNALTLTPIGNAPAFTSYQNFTAARFIAGANSTGNMSATFGGLATLNVYLGDGATRASTGNVLAGGEYVLVFAQSLNAGAGGFYLEQATVPVSVAGFAPQVQVFTAQGASTYTTPTQGGNLPLYLRVRMAASGGGGGAAGTNNGGNGGNTTFAAGTWITVGGSGGINGGGTQFGGAGGSGGANGTGTVVRRLAGGAGAGGANAGSATTPGTPSGYGGSNFFGGGAPSVAQVGGQAGVNATANTGGGGSGGVSGGSGGGGGGAGEYVEFIITSPAASYTNNIGAAGSGGAAGIQAGGNGALGRIEVEAFWQ